MSERILLAVDDSQASKRSVEYVSVTVAGRSDQYVHLVHVIPPEATKGSKAPESGAGDERFEWKHVDGDKWEMLGAMRKQLVGAGMHEDHVDVGVLTVASKGGLVEGLLDMARDQRCGTIVVGRSSLPWHRELFHDHPADGLIKKGQGFTIWVVE